MFEDYKGTFKKRGRLTAERRIKGAVATLVNQGLIQAGVGYDLTIRHFMNIGVWQGAGRVTVGEGATLAESMASVCKLRCNRNWSMKSLLL